MAYSIEGYSTYNRSRRPTRGRGKGSARGKYAPKMSAVKQWAADVRSRTRQYKFTEKKRAKKQGMVKYGQEQVKSTAKADTIQKDVVGQARQAWMKTKLKTGDVTPTMQMGASYMDRYASAQAIKAGTYNYLDWQDAARRRARYNVYDAVRYQRPRETGSQMPINKRNKQWMGYMAPRQKSSWDLMIDAFGSWGNRIQANDWWHQTEEEMGLVPSDDDQEEPYYEGGGGYYQPYYSGGGGGRNVKPKRYGLHAQQQQRKPPEVWVEGLTAWRID